MTQPLVTVGLPFYNAGDTLAETIRSIFAQSLSDWELILLDDGSSDRSLEIAQAVADPRVSVVSDGKHKTLAPRLNEIAQAARGRYLARMDADDLMHPDRLEEQVRYLDTHPEVDVVGTATYAIDHDGQLLGVRGLSPLDLTPAAVLKRGLFVHPTIMGRREWFRENPYDESFARVQDRELWCRTLGVSTFAHLPRPLLFYREGGPESLAKYLRSGAAVRRICRAYGPRMAGVAHTAVLYLASYLKGAAYAAATAVGRQSWLLRRRNLPLSAAEQAVACRALNAIRATGVPGLDSGKELVNSR